jgi:hypothetical protein
MKKTWIILGSIVVLLFILYRFFAGTYNDMVGMNEHGFKMLTVMDSSGIGCEFATQFRTPVRIHRELAAKLTLEMQIRAGGIRIVLPAFGRLPVCGRSPLTNQFQFVEADILPWSQNQRCFKYLAVSGQIPLTKRLGIQTIDKGMLHDPTSTILENTHRRTIRNVGRHRQAEKALKAQQNQRLKRDLFARKILQVLEHKNQGRGLSRNWRATAFA